MSSACQIRCLVNKPISQNIFVAFFAERHLAGAHVKGNNIYFAIDRFVNFTFASKIHGRKILFFLGPFSPSRVWARITWRKGKIATTVITNSPKRPFQRCRRLTVTCIIKMKMIYIRHVVVISIKKYFFRVYSSHILLRRQLFFQI